MPNDDLISRKQVINFLKTLAYDKDMSDEAATAICMAWGGIDRMLAVDAEPVRHGRWLTLAYDKAWTKCSECGCNWEWAMVENCNMAFCPNCGAKMDKEE